MATLTRSEVLNSFRTLQPNWDGYNADVPLPAVIDLALELVSLMEAILPSDARDSLIVLPVRHGGGQTLNKSMNPASNRMVRWSSSTQIN